MSEEILKLEPAKMWRYFHEITQVPRPSKKEEKIREYLVNFGKKYNLETIVDEIGNVLIRKEATPAMQGHKTVVLQSHMDMVCEKNSDIEFDFNTDAIQTYIEDGWVKAKGTTLGADDGIGIAASLAILDSDDIEHPPIEALFTMDEETGLTGAFGLSTDLLKGNILINLDSEDEGEIYIGCAGGRDTTAELELSYSKSKYDTSIRIDIKGLNGGHSGDDIQKGYGNANKLLNRVLYDFNKKYEFDLNIFHGGNLRNAIAREAYAILFINNDDFDSLVQCVNEYEITLKQEYHKTEPNLQLSIEKVEAENKVISKDNFKKITESIYACPHGVLAWSQDIDDFVETSTNLASVKLKNNRVIFTTSQRSSVGTALDDACNMVAANFSMIGAKVTHTDGYPGWSPNPNSEILEISKASYTSVFNIEPKVLAIHAGLECGLIGDKYPNMDMISIGPTVRGAHSPDERIDIKTAEMFWDYLIDILNKIPKA